MNRNEKPNDPFDDFDEDFEDFFNDNLTATTTSSLTTLNLPTSTQPRYNTVLNDTLSLSKYTQRMAGRWKMKKADNIQSYLQSVGVSWMFARLAAGTTADIEIMLTDSGFRQVTTTNGIVKKSSEQIITFGGKELFRNPLTSEHQLVSVIQSDEELKILYEHQAELII